MLELNKLLTVILMLLLHSHGATLTPATRHCTKHKAQQQYKERELPAVAPCSLLRTTALTGNS
jgi:hypothetical protein